MFADHSSAALLCTGGPLTLAVLDRKLRALTPYLCAATPSVARRTFSERELDRKEQKALMETTKAWAQINQRASSEGQAIFDLFTKT